MVKCDTFTFTYRDSDIKSAFLLKLILFEFKNHKYFPSDNFFKILELKTEHKGKHTETYTKACTPTYTHMHTNRKIELGMWYR